MHLPHQEEQGSYPDWPTFYRREAFFWKGKERERE